MCIIYFNLCVSCESPSRVILENVSWGQVKDLDEGFKTLKTPVPDMFALYAEQAVS